MTAACVDSNKKEVVNVYIRAIDLGRSTCPWPEIANGSPGYNPKFDFIAEAKSAPSLLIPAGEDPSVVVQPIPQEIPSPKPEPETTPSPEIPPQEISLEQRLSNGVQCIKDEKIDIITGGKALEEKSLVWNKLNNTIALAVVEPKSSDEVSKAISCLYNNGIRAVAKSGGHSYDGFSVLSDAVTINLNNMKNIKLNIDSTAVVQAGARLGDVYFEINKQSDGKYAVVGGTCPAVGVGGHFLGGGTGMLSRMSGLACDQLKSVTMIDYKGDYIIADENQNSELFWASCGGGGGNFGIVTEYTIKTTNIPDKVTTYFFAVEKGKLDYLEHIQTNVTKLASPLISSIVVNVEPDTLEVQGLFLGPKANLNAALEEAGLLKADIVDFSSKETTWIQSTVQFADYPAVKQPQDLTKIDLMESRYRTYFNLQSFVVLPNNPLPRKAFLDMLNWSIDNPSGFIEIDILGPRVCMPCLHCLP